MKNHPVQSNTLKSTINTGGIVSLPQSLAKIISSVKMKFVLALILTIFVADVKPLAREVADIVFKKYATIKILEDCYGKQTVNQMLAEVGLAYAKCRGQPSFLPILEQAIVQNAPANPASVSEKKRPTQGVPLVVYPEQSFAPLQKQPIYPWMGYEARDGAYPYYFRPNPPPYQQNYPHEDYFYDGPMINPEGYRWKRSDEEEPSSTDQPSSKPELETESQPELSSESVPESESSTPLGAEQQPTVTAVPSKPEGVTQPFSLMGYMQSNLFSKHQSIIGNMTCVMKEIGFIGEDLQPNLLWIRKRIDKLPVSDDLKLDLFEGIETCQQFSSCVPARSYGNIPAINELVRPYTFFKCFKGRKIEACMKKDLRDKLGGLLSGIVANQEKGKSKSLSERQETMDSIFNMAYGFDIDGSSDGFF